MKYNKFVVVSKSPEKTGAEAVIKCQPCEFHFELIGDNEKCFGGGMFIENVDKGELLLHGRSVDYGEPQFFGWDKLKLDRKYEGWTIIYVKDMDLFNKSVRLNLTKQITFE